GEARIKSALSSSPLVRTFGRDHLSVGRFSNVEQAVQFVTKGALDRTGHPARFLAIDPDLRVQHLEHMRPQALGQLVHHLLDLVARHDWAPWATYRNPCCSMLRLRKLQGKKRTPVKRTGVTENRQFIFLANCVRRKSVRNPNAFQRSRCST